MNSRGHLPIYYSSTSGISKSYAEQFEVLLEEEGFISELINVGDIEFDLFTKQEGTAVFFLSTYGKGDSPADGEEFLAWIEKLEKKSLFKNKKFIIIALGNKTYEHFCGHGRRVR